MVAESARRKLRGSRGSGDGKRGSPAGDRKPGGTGGGAAGKKREASTALEILARGGLVARGAIYVLIGWIAVQVAFGGSGQQADRTGALRLVGKSVAGEIALWLLIVGLVALCVWRLWEAIAGASGPDGDKATKRLGAAGAGVVYGVLAFSVAKYALGLGAPKGSGSQSQDLTAKLMHYPGGQVLVGIVGVALVAGGAWSGYQAFRKKFLEGMDLSSASPRTRRVVELLGQVGGMARAVIAIVAGVFLVIAAVHTNPNQAKGMDTALQALARTPLGPWLLVVVAIGLIIYGAFSVCESRYREI